MKDIDLIADPKETEPGQTGENNLFFLMIFLFVTIAFSTDQPPTAFYNG